MYQMNVYFSYHSPGEQQILKNNCVQKNLSTN